MQSKRDGLVPIGEMLSGLPALAQPDAKPQALHHFTLSDQVNQLVEASEADPDLGFMARLMALCSLPRTNPGDRIQYKRVNGPYTLYMTAGGGNKLPYGNLPRLILAWVSTEAVRTQSRVLILGSSLSEFMRKLEILSSNSGGAWGIRTRLRNQMRRLFRCTVSLIYEDERGDASVSSLIADRTEFWWSERKAELPSLWECNLHTIVRLPNSVFHPYASIGTNLLFFEKGETTQDIWFYEHSVPEGLFHDQADSAGTSATLHRLVGWGETQGPRGDRTRLEGGV